MQTGGSAAMYPEERYEFVVTPFNVTHLFIGNCTTLAHVNVITASRTSHFISLQSNVINPTDRSAWSADAICVWRRNNRHHAVCDDWNV